MTTLTFQQYCVILDNIIIGIIAAAIVACFHAIFLMFVWALYLLPCINLLKQSDAYMSQ